MCSSGIHFPNLLYLEAQLLCSSPFRDLVPKLFSNQSNLVFPTAPIQPSSSSGIHFPCLLLRLSILPLWGVGKFFHSLLSERSDSQLASFSAPLCVLNCSRAVHSVYIPSREGGWLHYVYIILIFYSFAIINLLRKVFNRSLGYLERWKFPCIIIEGHAVWFQ